MRYFATAFACLALLFAVACSAMVEDVASVAVHGPSDYNPHARSIRINSLDVALNAAPWRNSGSYQVTALDGLNRPDTATLNALRFTGNATNLTISTSKALQSVALYVRYDAAAVHPVQLGSGRRSDGIALNARVKPGLLAVAVAAIGEGVLSTRTPLASLSFAGGADTTQRTISIKHLSSNVVPDLIAIDNVDSSATLSWTERHVGDYDQNKEVNAADLSRLGKFLGSNPSSADWTESQLPDGDFNNEVNIADITPIGANIGSLIEGFDVFRKSIANLTENPLPTDAGWTKVLNTATPDGPSAPRQFVQQKTRLTYTFRDECGNGPFAWYVAGVAGPGQTPALGPPSVVAKQIVTPAGPPPAGLDFELIDDLDEFKTVGDEFYLAVTVSGVDSLFSANVRFEYDASVVEFIEGVAAYDDGHNHLNFLDPPLFVAVDDVDGAASPYVLLGFNATQTQGTPAKTGDGYLGYFKFKATAPGIITEAFRFPQASNFIYLWGETYGQSVASPALGSPQLLNIAP